MIDLTPIAALPVIGRAIDTAGIGLVRKLLAQLESGEALNVAVVSEHSNGNMMVAFSPGSGNHVKLVGAAGLLQRRIEDSIVDGK